MTSRSPLDHSYVPYTGKPYIYYAGVNVPRESLNEYPSSMSHPYRSIVVQTPEQIAETDKINTKKAVHAPWSGLGFW